MTDLANIDASYAVLKGRLSSLVPSALMRRDTAVSIAAQMGFPTTRNEDWKYTSLRPLLESGFKVPSRASKSDEVSSDFSEFNSLLIPESLKLVFIDGELSIALSDTRKANAGVSIKTLFEAEANDETYWKDLDSFPGLNQVFAQLAVGFADHGVVVKVAARTVAPVVLHICHITTSASKGTTRSTRNIIDVQRLSQVKVIEEFVNSEEFSHHHNSLTQIIAKEGSTVGYYRVDMTNSMSYLTSQLSVSIDRDAKVETFSLAAGGRLSRINIDVVYNGPGGECTLDGLYLLKGDQLIDHHTAIDHAVPQCHTRQLYKGILAGKSRAVFNGKIFIRRGATQTQAFQTNKNLLLSPDAEVDTKPELLIDNDDVKASHGAAVGAIDPKELFYLQSRAIDRTEAESILSRGFADEVVLRVEDHIARDLLRERVGLWFKKLVVTPVEGGVNEPNSL